MSRLADRLGVALRVVRAAHAHDVKYPAVALAYYLFVSFIPVLVLVLAVVGESFATRVQGAMPPYLTPEARQLVYEAMTAAAGRTGAVVFAIVVLAWSGANVAVGFLTVVERVENTTGGSLSAQLRDAVSILGSLALVMVVIVLMSVILRLGPDGTRVGAGGLMVMPFVLAAAFLPLYYLPSRAVTSARTALPGAFTAAFGWTALLTVVQLYAANATRYAVYGVLSGVIIILTSLYLAAVVLMVGVVVNATLTDGTVAAPSSR